MIGRMEEPCGHVEVIECHDEKHIGRVATVYAIGPTGIKLAADFRAILKGGATLKFHPREGADA